MVVRRIAEGGDPKTVTVGEVATAVSIRRRAPALPPGSASRFAAIMARALATIS
jgi:hypothetical protein